MNEEELRRALEEREQENEALKHRCYVLSRIKRKCKNPKWIVIINCQGEPFYYGYKTMVGAFVGYAYLYHKYYKYHTMNFKLYQFEVVTFWDDELKMAFKAESEYKK